MGLGTFSSVLFPVSLCSCVYGFSGWEFREGFHHWKNRSGFGWKDWVFFWMDMNQFVTTDTVRWSTMKILSFEFEILNLLHAI